jgi:uncharacterized repeat protein (TIGR01451 family)
MRFLKTALALVALAVTAVVVVAPAQAIAQADIVVTKTGPATAVSGANVTYTVTVANQGGSSATAVDLQDVTPSGTTFFSEDQSCSDPSVGSTGTVDCTVGTLNAGASFIVHITLKVNSNVASGTVITNAATATTSSAQSSTLNDSGASDVTTTTSADLAVTKTGPATAMIGADVTYYVTVTNNGPSDAAGLVVNDSAPADESLVSVSQTSGPSCCAIPAGQSVSLTYVEHMSSTATPGTLETNQFSASASTPDPDTSNNTASTTASAIAGQADLAVTKTGPANVTAGTQMTYDIDVTNNGPADARNLVVSDPLPSGETLVSNTQTSGPTAVVMASGETRHFQIVVAVGSGVTNASTLTNTATVSSDTADPTAPNNSSTLVTTVNTSADLQVSKTGPANAFGGQDVSYSITETNAGPSDALAATLTDPTPANTTPVSFTQDTGSTDGTTLLPGASRTFTMVVHVNHAYTGTVTNVATVATTTSDPTPGNNTSTVNTTIAAASANLSITKTGPSSGNAGSIVNYTVTVTNNGPSDYSDNVDMTDVTPANTTFVQFTQTSGPSATLTNPSVGGTGTMEAKIVQLNNGASMTFLVRVAINASTAAGTTISNTANVSSDNPDANSANNSATKNTSVTTSADIAVSITGPSSSPVGTNSSYTVTITNNGPSTATNVSVKDTFGTSGKFVSSVQNTGPAFTCVKPAVGAKGGVVHCTIASLAIGQSATFTVTLHAVNTTSTVSTVMGSSATPDPNTVNNKATKTTTH